MLKRTITYTDFNGNERTENFYFNLTKAEVVEMEMRENLKGGLHASLQEVVDSNDGGKIMDFFRNFIRLSYGIKDSEGRSFLKSPEIADGFMGTEAYSQLFMELISEPKNAADFVNAIIPADLSEEAQKIQNAQGNTVKKPQDFNRAKNPAATNDNIPDAQAPKTGQPDEVVIETSQSVGTKNPTVEELEAQLKAAREAQNNQ